jgi:hypothetical protein
MVKEDSNLNLRVKLRRNCNPVMICLDEIDALMTRKCYVSPTKVGKTCSDVSETHEEHVSVLICK